MSIEITQPATQDAPASCDLSFGTKRSQVQILSPRLAGVADSAAPVIQPEYSAHGLAHVAERWLPCPGFESKYEVSNLGRVRNRRTCQIIRPFGNRGYLRSSLNGGRDKPYVNVLVAKAFIPNPLGLPEVNHIDTDKTNNAATNLEWMTRQQNMDHAKVAGVLAVGSRNGGAKLTEGKVKNILDRRSAGASINELRKQYGIGQNSLYCILRGETWKHVKRRSSGGEA